MFFQCVSCQPSASFFVEYATDADALTAEQLLEQPTIVANQRGQLNLKQKLQSAEDHGHKGLQWSVVKC